MSERTLAPASAKRQRCRRTRRAVLLRAWRAPATRQAKFLKAFWLLGSVKEAAADAGISPRTHYSWMRDPGYVRRFAVVHRAAVDLERRIYENERYWDWGMDPVERAEALLEREKRPPFASRIRSRAPE